MVDKPRRAVARLALGLAIRTPGGSAPCNTESEPARISLMAMGGSLARMLSLCATDVSQVSAGLFGRSLRDFRWARATTS
jgi:hypothetical protein